MRAQALQVHAGHPIRHRLPLPTLRASAPSLRRVNIAASTSSSGSTGDCTQNQDNHDSHTRTSVQQKVVRTAMVGVTAAALGLALFQGHAKAAGTAASSIAPVITTQVRQATSAAPAALASAAAVAPAMLDHNSNTKEALHYRLMQLFAAPVYGKVLAVLAVAAPILALGSILYHKAAQGTTWTEAVVKPYAVLLNCPGKLGVKRYCSWHSLCACQQCCGG